MSKCEDCIHKLDFSNSVSDKEFLICHECVSCELGKSENFKGKKKMVKKWRWVAPICGSKEIIITKDFYTEKESYHPHNVFLERIYCTEKEFEE